MKSSDGVAFKTERQRRINLTTTHMKPRPRTPVIFSGAAAVLLAGGLCCLLTQCSVTDPGYEALAAKAEAKPSKNAIVGMWHLKVEGSLMDTKRRCSYLFRRDGTGLGRSTLDNVTAEEEFLWDYPGNGIWNIRSSKDWSGHLRVSDGKLLLTFEYKGAVGKRVLMRVQ